MNVDKAPRAALFRQCRRQYRQAPSTLTDPKPLPPTASRNSIFAIPQRCGRIEFVSNLLLHAQISPRGKNCRLCKAWNVKSPVWCVSVIQNNATFAADMPWRGADGAGAGQIQEDPE